MIDEPALRKHLVKEGLLLVADHNAYHLGQLVQLGKTLEARTEGSARPERTSPVPILSSRWNGTNALRATSLSSTGRT